MKNNNRYVMPLGSRLRYFFLYTLWTPFRCVKNYFFCLKYPFWRARNVWTDKPCGYSFTLYDNIPYGWRKAFGKKLSKELKKALIEDNYLKEFRFTQIKEKWGELCLYNNGCGNHASAIISKYELMSKGYCINCGKPARYLTHGYVSYLCEDCYEKLLENCKESNINEYLEIKKNERLTKDDLPYIVRYTRDGELNLDIKDEYGIDFEKMWGLNDGKDTK